MRNTSLRSVFAAIAAVLLANVAAITANAAPESPSDGDSKPICQWEGIMVS